MRAEERDLSGTLHTHCVEGCGLRGFPKVPLHHTSGVLPPTEGTLLLHMRKTFKKKNKKNLRRVKDVFISINCQKLLLTRGAKRKKQKSAGALG